MSGPSLTLVPQILAQLAPMNGDAYQLYSGQVVTLVATLYAEDLQDGELIDFVNIALDSQGLPNQYLEFMVYPPDQPDIDTSQSKPNQFTVAVKLAKTGYGVGEAKLSVWLAGVGNFDPHKGNVYAQRHSNTNVQSAKLDAQVQTAVVVAPVIQSGVYMPMSTEDMIPSQGAFIYCRFDAYDASTFAPVPSFRLQLTGGPQLIPPYYYATTLALFYEDYAAASPDDAIAVLATAQSYSVNLATDQTGAAQVYVCPRKNCQIMATLSCNGSPLTEYVVVDLTHPKQEVDNPYPDPVYEKDGKVQMEGQAQFPVTIPRYPGVSPNDIIYLFCNGEYQTSMGVGDNQQTPLGDLKADCRRLRSVTYASDQPHNAVCYAVQPYVDGQNSDTPAFVSRTGYFYAEGRVLAATPLAVPEGYQSAPAPVLPDNPYGLPLNCANVAAGVRLSVPLAGLKLAVGDKLMLRLYLNGSRQAPYKLQPIAAAVAGPLGLSITPDALANQCVQWWFQARTFMGFGKNSLSEPGTFQAQYLIVGKYACYCSDVLTLALDTIPPAGANDGPPSFFARASSRQPAASRSESSWA